MGRYVPAAVEYVVYRGRVRDLGFEGWNHNIRIGERAVTFPWLAPRHPLERPLTSHSPPSLVGCGKHIDSCLTGIAMEDRCKCKPCCQADFDARH